MRTACPPAPPGRATAEELALEFLRRADEDGAAGLDAFLEGVPLALRDTCRRRVDQLRQLRTLLEEIGCEAFDRLPPGARLGPYRIVRELGRGGMGTVYLALVEGARGTLRPGDRVAVKVIHPYLDSPTLRRRLRREAEVGRLLDHPNVVRVHDCGDRYLVMEYVEGETLLRALRRRRRLPAPLCLRIARGVAAALAALHERGVVHRDLKPENVLLARDGTVKLLDLGVSRPAGEGTRLSATGAFVGTVLYAAPEQFTGEGIDGRADLYALGLVLHEMATGRLPSKGDEPARILHQRLVEGPEAAAAVPPALRGIVRGLLARDPAARPSALALLAEAE